MNQGRYFEDFDIGSVYEHSPGRTLTQADNIWFTLLTLNTNPIHFDSEYARQTEFKRPLVNSCFTLGLMVGISVNDTTQGTAVANLGWDEVRFPAPIFVGDTLRIETEVLEVRESRSRPNQGIVTFAHRAYNQNGELVAHCKRASLQRKRPS